MYTERAESNPGVDPRLPRTQIEHTAIGRVTWQMSERLKLSQMLENEWYAFPSLPSVTRPFETVTNLGSNKLPVYASEANWTRSSNTLIIIRATGWFNPQDYVKPLSGDTTTSFRLDQSTGSRAAASSHSAGSSAAVTARSVKSVTTSTVRASITT
jgi:hypothetical protein